MSTDANHKKARHRSPAYPSIDLGAAVAKAKALYDEEKLNSFTPDVALEHWEYEAGSANGMRVLAALKQYGLLDEDRSKDERELKLTHLAVDLLLPESEWSDEHRDSLHEAALKPSVFNDIWSRHLEDGLPSDRNLERYLIKEKKFNPTAVPSVIRLFRDTVSFAQLSSSDILDDETPPNDEGVDDDSDRGDDKSEHGDAPKKKRQERRQMEAGVKEAIYPMATGDVVLTWPDRISPDEAEDLNDWLDIMKRKLRRSIVDETSPPEED